MSPGPSIASALGLSLALGAACYASHDARPGGGSGSADGGARTDGAGLGADAGSVPCEELPGASVCGCVGGYRRCDLCEERCPTGQLCWPSLGVCRPADGVGSTGVPVFDSCALPTSAETVGPRYCPGGGPCVLSGPDDLFGPCMSDAFCREGPAAEPPLHSDVRCIASFGLEWRPPPPADTCPDRASAVAPAAAAPTASTARSPAWASTPTGLSGSAQTCTPTPARTAGPRAEAAPA